MSQLGQLSVPLKVPRLNWNSSHRHEHSPRDHGVPALCQYRVVATTELHPVQQTRHRNVWIARPEPRQPRTGQTARGCLVEIIGEAATGYAGGQLQYVSIAGAYPGGGQQMFSDCDRCAYWKIMQQPVTRQCQCRLLSRKRSKSLAFPRLSGTPGSGPPQRRLVFPLGARRWLTGFRDSRFTRGVLRSPACSRPLQGGGVLRLGDLVLRLPHVTPPRSC